LVKSTAKEERRKGPHLGGEKGQKKEGCGANGKRLRSFIDGESKSGRKMKSERRQSEYEIDGG